MEVAEVHKSSTAKNEIQTKRQPFFNKEGEGSFFSKSNEATTPFFSPTTIQPKLTIGQPNDKYEVEADAMADKVVQRLNSPFEGGQGDVSQTNNSVAIQAKCSHCEEEEKVQKKGDEELLQNKLEIQRKPIFESNAEQPEANIQAKPMSANVIQAKCASCDEEEKRQKKEDEGLLQNKLEVQSKPVFESNAEQSEANIQTKPLATTTIQAKCSSCEQEEKLQKKEEEELPENELSLQRKGMDMPSENTLDLESRLSSSKGGGSSLPSNIQSSMGSEFGTNFNNVKVHTGTQAVQMSQDIGAQAFTHGSDIYFNQGKYDTNSGSGKTLLAHELTHVVQQGGAKNTIQAKFKLNELKNRKTSDLKTSPKAYFYLGSTANNANKKALIIAGLHSREKSPCELANKIKGNLDSGSLKPDLHTVVIPCVVPFKKGERGIGSGKERVADANRAFGKPSPNPEINEIQKIITEFDPDQTVSIHAISDPKLAGIFLDPKHSGKFPNTKKLIDKRKAFTKDARNEEAMRLTEDMITAARRSEGNNATRGNDNNTKAFTKGNTEFPQNEYPGGGESPFNLLYPQQGQVNTAKRPTSLGTWMSSLGKTVITMELPGYAKPESTWKYYIPALERFVKLPGTRAYGPEVYTEKEKLKYLIGTMDGKKAGLDFGKAGRKVDLGKGEKPQMLRKDLNLRESSFRCLEAMMKAAKKDGHYINPFSGTRLFKDQKKIWEQKFNFTRAGKWGRLTPKTWKAKYPKKCVGLKGTENEWNSNGGKNLIHKTCWEGLSNEEKAREILKTSSGPGFSRHHWGTDVDINSDNPQKWETDKKLVDLYKWLQQNAKNYGYYESFNAGRPKGKGYTQEKWHWSFAPIAIRLQEDYEKNVLNAGGTGRKLLEKEIAKVAGKKEALKLFEEYVKTINPILRGSKKIDRPSCMPKGTGADVMDKRVMRKPMESQSSDTEKTEQEGIQLKCSACDDGIQKKLSTAAPANHAPSGLESRISASQGGGASLGSSVNRSMSQSFGHDFSKVKIHTNNEAVQMNKELGAQAFTHGNDIYFNQGKYDTNSNSGKHLLAHELTHTVQQGSVESAPNNVIQKNGGTEERGNPPRAGISVGMTGIRILPRADSTFEAGSKAEQSFHILIYRLISDEYTNTYTERLWTQVQSTISGIGTLSGTAVGGEEIPQFFVPIKILDPLIAKLRHDGHTIMLGNNQMDILRFGVFAVMAWNDYHIPEVASQIDVSLPSWFSQHLFIKEISHHIGLLRIYVDEVQLYSQERNQANKARVVNALANIIYAIEGVAALLEVIRIDDQLIAHPIYKTLWPAAVAAEPGNQVGREPQEPQMASENQQPNSLVASSFFSFSRTQPDLSRNSFTQSQSRKELMDRFERFLVRGVSSATGDQQLSDEPGTANTSPHNARMNVSPGLSGPQGGLQLEASAAADYRFIMSLLFPSVFDAFQRYYFEWNYVRVPDEQLGNPVDYEELEQQDPSNWDVASNRFARAGRYAVEDVETLFESLGPFGVGAVSLVAANTILRFISTGIRLGFEMLTMPDSEKLIQFPGPGVYMVRCKAIPDHGENSEIVRSPSVAFQPIIVKDPLEMIRSRVDQHEVINQNNFERMHDLREKLSENISYEGKEDDRKELEILEQSLSSVGGSLEVQKQQLEAFINDTSTREDEKRRAQKQLENLVKIIELRNARGEEHDLTGAEPLNASFVSDTGQSLRLSLEAVNKFGGDTHEYWVSDLTTANSSQATGYGTNRQIAILDAIEKILEGIGGYGRGYVAVSVDGVTYNRRIASSLGNLFMEAIENVSTVLSLAAVIAAPFTGGASLTLLLPIGVVGAVPSAYRLINRSIDNTFRFFDMATAMDIINIVGGVIGLSHVAVPLRMIRTGRVLYLMGLGLDGLGVLMIPVGVMSQIMQLEGLPPGERAARIMEILGHAMLNVGIMAGGIIAARARQRNSENSRNGSNDGSDIPSNRGIELDDLPQNRQSLTDIKSDMIQINGKRHQVSVSFEDGHLFIRICSDCGHLIQRMYQLLQDPSVPTELKTNVRELLNRTEALQGDIDLGRRDTESTEVQHDIDNIAWELAGMAGAHPSFIEPILTPTTAGPALTPLAINEFRGRIEELGRRPGRNADSLRYLEMLENEILPRTDLTNAEKRLAIGSLIEALTYNRAPTRSSNMIEVDMADPSVRSIFENAIADPTVEGIPAWRSYIDIVRSKYFGRRSLNLGRSPRSTDGQAVSGTDSMRAAFIDGMNTGTVLPEAAVMVRRHLNRAIENAGSAEAAVAIGDAVWIDGLRGGRVNADHPNAVLWPADPSWGVWRVDHIVELQHGGSDQPHNYVPVTQVMHDAKSRAMNDFGRRIRSSGLTTR